MVNCSSLLNLPYEMPTELTSGAVRDVGIAKKSVVWSCYMVNCSSLLNSPYETPTELTADIGSM